MVEVRRLRRLLAGTGQGPPGGLAGYVDLAGTSTIAGWSACETGDTVTVSVPGLFADVVVCDLERPDLRDAGFESGRGFHVVLPETVFPEPGRRGVTRVEVRDTRTGRHLHGSPLLAFDVGRLAQPQLSIFSVLFYDAEGREFLHGGAERYLIDLAEVAASKGLDTVVYQASSRGRWTQSYRGLTVHGVPWDFSDLKELSVALHRAAPPAALNVYSPFVLAAVAVDKPAIGISHGVFWDAPGNHFHEGANEELVLSGLLHCDETVSVDTNTINFVRAIRSGLASDLRYVPNYVSEEFFTAAGPDRDADEVVIGFPRRLYDARGLGLIERVIPHVLREFPHARFELVGGISAEDRPRLDRLLAEDPRRVTWRQVQPDQMSGVYPGFDIALVPTVHSEGTSLSALEAMAAGNCVVATNVGGLPDIVVDGVSGVLIEPTAEALHEALTSLLDDPDTVRRLGEQARDFARHFSKARWTRSWDAVFERHRGTREWPDSVTDEGRPLVHVRTPGITWGTMVQRPHHICRAAAELGLPVYFVSDAVEPPEAVQDAEEHGVVLVQPDMQLHLDEATLYYYYAHSTPELVRRFGSGQPVPDVDAAEADFSGTVKYLHVRSADLWFDVLDHPEIHERDERYPGLFAESLAAASVVTCSSVPLLEHVRERSPGAVLLPNGVFVSDFAESVQQRRRALDRSTAERVGSAFGLSAASLRTRTVALYYGAIAGWVDVDLLRRVADSDGVTLLVAGPVATDKELEARELFRHEQVEYLGVVDYADLPLLTSLADVGVVPFDRSRTALVDAVLPLKLLEFLASGLPVVTTRLAAIEAAVHDAPAGLSRRLIWSDELVPGWSARLPELTGDDEVREWLARSDWVSLVQAASLGLTERWRRLTPTSAGRAQDRALAVVGRGAGVDIDVELEHLDGERWVELAVDHSSPAAACVLRADGAGSMLAGDVQVSWAHLGQDHAVALSSLLTRPFSVPVQPGLVRIGIKPSLSRGEGRVRVTVSLQDAPRPERT